MKIAVIGSTMMDVVSYIDRMPQAGETRMVKDFHVAGGGKGANQAVAAAKLGAEVLFLTAVGNDAFGRQAISNYEKLNIDTSYIKTVEGTSTGVATIMVDEKSGQNRIMIYQGANAELLPEDIEKAADGLKKCGIMILQQEIPLETVYAAIRFANANGMQVILNPAPANDALSMEMACKCDFFMPNETELSLIAGVPTNSIENIREAARALLSGGLKNIIVTMGSEGALWLTADKEELVPSLKVKAVDSTGAGDSFIGCFAQWLAHTGDISAAIRRAAKYAALGVTRPGTQDSYAMTDEFEKFLQTVE